MFPNNAGGKHGEGGMSGRRVGDPWHPSSRSVLVALRDPLKAGLVARQLSERQAIPTLVFSCHDLLTQVSGGAFGLVVLDPALPCGHGKRCIQEVRRLSTAPIIALSTQPQEESDADLVLDSRDELPVVGDRGASLLQMSRPVDLPEPIRWGPLELDVRKHEARWDGKGIHLTAIQFRIMEVLALAAGGVVATDELARRVWGDAAFDDHNRLVAHVRRIRKLVEHDSTRPQFLIRVRGHGFRLLGG